MKLSDWKAYWKSLTKEQQSMHGLSLANETIAQLEAEIAAHKENEGDECPLCQLEAELADIKESHRIVMDEKCPSDEVHCTCVPILRAENEMLIDALEHCGYDPNDCIDCGGPPHNEWCRFWKLRRTLSFWTPDPDALLTEDPPSETPISDVPITP